MTKDARHPWQLPPAAGAGSDWQVRSRKCAGFFDSRRMCLGKDPRRGLSLQGSALPAALAPLRCSPPGRWSEPARPDLLQLPERADEARAEAEDDEQQQEGLIDGRDVYHGDDEATPVPGVPARTALVGPQCVVNGGGASGATSKAPRWNSSPTVSCGAECCASSVNAA